MSSMNMRKGCLLATLFIIGVPVLIAAALILKGMGLAGSYIGSAMDTAYAETNPARLLEKYEWFKDASAQLDAKVATLQQYQAKVADLEADYDGTLRSQWAREDRQQVSLWKTELDGLATSYNNLAAEYNAQMAKLNYRFINVGDLPAGQTVPMPREYRPYLAGDAAAGLRVEGASAETP